MTPGRGAGTFRQCFAKCPFTCQFDRLSDQLCQSLDRLSDHFAKHCFQQTMPRTSCADATASVLYSDRRAVQAIGRIDRGADQNEGLNGTLPTAAGRSLMVGRLLAAEDSLFICVLYASFNAIDSPRE